MLDITIRLEEEKDYQIVEEVTRAAFGYPERIKRGGIGCPYEHWMVHALREQDGIKELSYVAEVQNKIVGHIIYSNSKIVTHSGDIIPVINLGPLSVHPEYQRGGIGKSLIRATIEEAKRLQYGAILFFGRPEYYPQFGFVEAKTYHITDCEGYNYPAFHAMELKEGYLHNITGRYYESDIYDDSKNRDKVVEYDKLFHSNNF